MRPRTVRLPLLIVMATTLVGCGGATRAEWVASITPTCDRIQAAGQSIRMDEGMQPAQVAAGFDKALVDVTPMIAELKAADRPKDDAEVEAWLALQDEGLVVMRELSTALKSGDPAQLQQAGAKLEDYRRRDKQAASTVGAPASCHD